MKNEQREDWKEGRRRRAWELSHSKEQMSTNCISTGNQDDRGSDEHTERTI